MQKIVPHLWFDKEAVEAATWYVSLFEDSKLIHVATIPDTPSGDAELVDFQLAGMRFEAINGGPYFKLNPSISLMVACSTAEEVDRLHESLSSSELMPLGEYPFSKRYAWVQDRYGLSWQLMLVEDMTEHRRIRPSLLFAGEACGKAEEWIDFCSTVFKKSEKGYISNYASGESMDSRAKINYGELEIFGTWLIVMDHGMGGDFTFNEAFSLIVFCKDQEEIDYYWDMLSFVPEAEQCGWLKDQFGLSWQIVPDNMDDIMMNGTKEEIRRVTEALLEMKKFDLAALEKARAGL